MKQLDAAHGAINMRIGWKAKQELIRTIQEKRGNTPCFQTGKPSCDQYDCCWRGDCKPGEMSAAV